MADNTQLNQGSGGAVYGDDDIGGIHYQRIKIIHGVDGVNDGDVATSNPLPVTVISGGGAGTQYTEGDVDASITGNALLVEGAGNALVPAQGTVADGLLVNLGANNDVTISGSVTITDGGATVSIDDGGASITVDGSVTIGAALPAGTNNIGDVDIASLPAPLSTTGGGTEATALRVTIATDSTGVVSVDDNGSTLSIDDGAGSITVDYATTGSGTATGALRVELPTNGTGTIASITTSVVPGTAATNLGKAVDGVAGATDTGVMALAVRDDALAALTPADGDYTQLRTTSQGRLWTSAVVDTALPAGTNNIGDVDVLTLPALPAGTNNIGDVDVASIAAGDNAIGRVKLTDGTDVADILDLTNSNPLTVAIVDTNGDQIASFGGGTQYTEDAAAAANPVGTAVILVRADTPAGAVSADGDNVAQRGTNFGAAYVQVVDSSGNFINTFGGGTQYTEGDTDATITGTAMLVEGAGDALATVKVGGGTEAAAVRVTIASDSTGVLSVDDNGGALTVDNGGTFAVQVDGSALTALQLIDDPVMTLGTTTYTETTTKGTLAAAIRRDADTSAVNTDNEAAPLLVNAIGALKVEIFDGGESHTVDNATLSVVGGGVEATALRVTIASDSTGVLSVDDNGASLTVDNGGTFVTQENGAALTALQLIDNPVSVLGTATYTEATSSGMLIGAVRRDADTTAVNTDNEVAPLLVNAIGALKVEIFDGGDSHTVDGTVTANLAAGTNNIGDVDVLGGTVAHDAVGTGVNPLLAGGYASAAAPADVSADGDAVRAWHLRNGAQATVITAAGALVGGDATNGLDVDVTRVPAPLSTTGGGTEATALRVTLANDSTGVVSVDDNGASLTVDYATTGSGTATGALRVELANNGTGVLATVGTVTTVSTVTTVTGSGVAHDAVDSGNPHKIGAKAETSPKGITLVADADRTDLLADADGMLMVKLNTSGADLVSERVTNTDGASTAFTNFSAVASTRNYVTAYSVFRTDSGTTPIYVDFRDGTAGSILWSVVLPPNGGANLASAMPLFKTSANTALAFDVSAATTTVFISVSGYQSKVG